MSHVTSKIFLAAHRSINLNKQKERACLFTLSAESVCLLLMNTRFTFLFQKCKMSREFCHSLIGCRHTGYCHKNHKFWAPMHAPLIFSFREQIVGASDNWASLR